MTARVHAMRSTGAEVVKIAATLTSLSDCVPLLDLGAQSGRQSGLVLIGMGPYGLVDPRARRALRIDLDLRGRAEARSAS